MEKKLGRRTFFPYYLRPGPDPVLLKWVGEYLKKMRGGRTRAEIAKALNIAPEEIERIEQGDIRKSLGCFRQILRHGYKCKLEDVLEECFEAFKTRFDPKGRRRFERDYHYSLCLPDKDGNQPTPLLIGGDPESFLWAIPLRKLNNQPLSIDFLELAPARKRKARGTPENSHDGVEVIHVVHGTIQVSIESGSELGAYIRKLKAGESIHYKSNLLHQIANDGNTTSVLLLIVRMPEL